MRHLPMLAGILLATAAFAQHQPRTTSGATPVKPRIDAFPGMRRDRPLEPVVPRTILLALARDGHTKIDTIDGKRRPVTIHGGVPFKIEGSGFGYRDPGTMVVITPDPAIKLSQEIAILSWSDTMIVLRVPNTNSFLGKDAPHADLWFQMLRDGPGGKSFNQVTLRDIHYIAH